MDNQREAEGRTSLKYIVSLKSSQPGLAFLPILEVRVRSPDGPGHSIESKSLGLGRELDERMLVSRALMRYEKRKPGCGECKKE